MSAEHNIPKNKNEEQTQSSSTHEQREPREEQAKGGVVYERKSNNEKSEEKLLGKKEIKFDLDYSLRRFRVPRHAGVYGKKPR